MGVGFEPTKAKPTDLQSAPVDRLGIPPRCEQGILWVCYAHVNSLTEGSSGFLVIQRAEKPANIIDAGQYSARTHATEPPSTFESMLLGNIITRKTDRTRYGIRAKRSIIISGDVPRKNIGLLRPRNPSDGNGAGRGT